MGEGRRGVRKAAKGISKICCVLTLIGAETAEAHTRPRCTEIFITSSLNTLRAEQTERDRERQRETERDRENWGENV